MPHSKRKKINILKKENKKLLLYLLCNSVILIAIYFLMVEKFQLYFFSYVYLLAGAALGLYFIIYNRGFVAKNATPESLPDTMTLAEKKAFIEDGKARLRRSRWILTILLPIILAIAADMIYLYVYPMLKGIF